MTEHFRKPQIEAFDRLSSGIADQHTSPIMYLVFSSRNS
jgi:hypothetical protein